MSDVRPEWFVADDDDFQGCAFIPVESSAGDLICEVHAEYADDESDGELTPRRREWAKLIAAAPDLIAALKGNAILLNALLAAHEAEPFREHMDPAKRFQNDLRNQAALTAAAIAKATGP